MSYSIYLNHSTHSVSATSGIKSFVDVVSNVTILFVLSGTPVATSRNPTPNSGTQLLVPMEKYTQLNNNQRPQ